MNRLATIYRFPAQGRCHTAHADEACPASTDHTRCVQVRVDRVSALLAPEFRLARPVAPLGMSAPRTGLRGLARIHRDDLNARQPRLVFDELQKLAEGP